MQVFRDLQDPRVATPAVLTFGVFDGLHLGHQLIMRTVAERASAAGLPATVVTFEPHPRAVVHPESAPPLLQTFEQKMRGMERLGIDQVIVLSFTRELSLVTAEDFLASIVFGRLDARESYLGAGFAFGHDREGRFDLLKNTADRLGRVAAEVPEVLMRGQRVSSTSIRRLLAAGRVNLARRMLGRPYDIESRVVEGRKLGKAKLGYGTANLRPVNQVVPANGVYVTLTRVDGEWRRSVTNVGYRPTFGGDAEVTVESHIVDFDREIYGENISVRFLHRLRGEMKFESIESLRRQVDRDYRRTVKYFDMRGAGRNFEFR
jgi:riboflavin kinase/FMN adenylyltransferase